MFLLIAIYLLIQFSTSLARTHEEEKFLIIKISNEKDYDILNRLDAKILKKLDLINASLIKIKSNHISDLLNQGIRIYENKKVKSFLHDSARIIFVDSAWNLNLSGSGIKVCILDTGIDYKHKAIDTCESVEILNGSVEDYVLESPHPYPANFNFTWTITKPGFTSISVHFVNVSVETNYDFIYIKDKNNNIVQVLSGNYKDMWSVSVPGDTVKINLVSDWYMSWYGFYIDKVINGSVLKSLKNCTRILAAYDFVNEDFDPMDDNGHGTHVAGIIISQDSYSRGIAYGSNLLIAKVLDSKGEGSYADVISGIEWCIKNDAKIISLSLGGELYSESCDEDLLAQAVNSAVDKGVIVVVSSGNSGGCGISTPACASKAIAVGAIDKNENVVGFSGRGKEIDFVAPGYSINSTYLKDSWKIMSGTSMSAPHIAGAIALLLEANLSLSPDEIKNILKESAYLPEKCFESYRIVNGICAYIGEEEVECNSNILGSGIVNVSKVLEITRGEKREPIIEFLINGREENITIGDNETINISVRIIEGEGEVTIFENGNLIGKASPNITIIKNYDAGLYNLTVFYGGSFKYLPYSKSLFILVKDVTPPKITLLSPRNTTYFTRYSNAYISLLFNLNENVSWTVYRLDDCSDVELNGNVTLNVQEGTHKIILCAKDFSNNIGCSNEIFFTVKKVSSGGGCGKYCLLV